MSRHIYLEGGAMSVTVLGAVAGTWAVVMALSPLLQILRMARRRSSEDVSISYLIVITIGFSLWVAYGLSIENAVLVIPNSIAFVVGVATISVALRYRSARSKQMGKPGDGLKRPGSGPSL
jgi:MtN3 and saliva related transmembrane protein